MPNRATTRHSTASLSRLLAVAGLVVATLAPSAATAAPVPVDPAPLAASVQAAQVAGAPVQVTPVPAATAASAVAPQAASAPTAPTPGAAADDPRQVGARTPTPSAPGTPVVELRRRTVAIVLLNFSNDRRTPWDKATVLSRMFSTGRSVNSYWKEVTGGALSLTGQVFGYYTIKQVYCDEDQIAALADARLAAAGVDVDAYDHIVYAFPRQGCAGYAGLGSMPGKHVWINGYFLVDVVAHELGHNFGSEHASTVSCYANGVRVALNAKLSSCGIREYGDPLSIMGASEYLRHPSNADLDAMGMIPAAQRLEVQASGTYTLAAAELVGTTKARILAIPRPDGTYLALELRKPYGTYFDAFATTSPVVRGVSIRVARAPNDHNWPYPSYLVDTTPGTTTFADSALLPGRSFKDPLTGIRITTVGVSAGVATVQVVIPVDTTAPTAPVDLVAAPLDAPYWDPDVDPLPAPGLGVALAWEAARDNRSVASYQVLRDGAVIATLDAAARTFTDPATDVEGGLLAGTTYTYGVRAIDTSGNAGPAATFDVFMPAVAVNPSYLPEIWYGSMSVGSLGNTVTVELGFLGVPADSSHRLHATIVGSNGYRSVIFDGCIPADNPDWVLSATRTLPTGPAVLHLWSDVLDPDSGQWIVNGDLRIDI